MYKWIGPLRAEWTKVARNYKLHSFLVWIFPIGMFAFYGLMIVAGLLYEPARPGLVYGCNGQWTDNFNGLWSVLSVFPGSIFGRILPLAFFAVVFAGEYQWGTWKNLVPRNRRQALLLCKGTIAALAVTFSLFLAALLSAGGQALLCKVGGASFGPALSFAVLQANLLDFLLSILTGILPLLMILGFAAIASVVTRSILGGFLGGFGLSLLELMILSVLLLLRNLFGRPEIVNLYRFAPSFNLDNLRMWFFQGQAFQGEFVGMTVTFSVGQSLAVMAIWILVPLCLTMFSFQRQDLTS